MRWVVLEKITNMAAAELFRTQLDYQRVQLLDDFRGGAKSLLDMFQEIVEVCVASDGFAEFP